MWTESIGDAHCETQTISFPWDALLTVSSTEKVLSLIRMLCLDGRVQLSPSWWQ